MRDIWSEAPEADFRGEGNVELRLVIPLLHALGYDDDDIDSKFPVVFQEGRSGRKHEADFVCFHGPLHNRDTSLLVVEAKRPGEALADGKVQGESYAANLRAPLLLLTNGEALEIWQIQKTQESVCVLAIPVSSLATERGQIERLLCKEAVLDYCSSFQVKTILEASADYGRFETAELRRILRRERQEPSIERTVRQTPKEAQAAPLETDQILFKFPNGSFIVASSGYGKTTLCRRLLRQAIEERQRTNRTTLPFDVPLPDLEQTKVSVIDFMRQRLSAHCPGVTPASFAKILRDIGATILCDGYDRTTATFQKRIASELDHIVRDYPLIQIFVFARTGQQCDFSLPPLTLLPLSDEQMRELEKLVLADGSPIFYSIIGMMPPTLRALCENPLVLRQVLAYWKQHNDFPQRIESLFQSWLNNVLETEPSDFVSIAQREQALQLLAQATVDSPIVRTKAISLLRAPRKIAPNGRLPRNCLRMIRVCSRFDSQTFTPGGSAIGTGINFSRCP
jgi:Type I restriction enzyme R protein N terminus (HSDR_N)